MPSTLSYATTALAVFSCSIAAQRVEVGKPAPPVSLEQTIPAARDLTLASLKGKPTVIEFWATWCGYCIQEIPHLNALADKFRDVRFLSITDEQPSTVEPFLAKRPISGEVGIDRDGSTFKAYGIEGRPQTVLVDKDGVVRGTLYPTQLTAAVLENFISGRPLNPTPLRRGLRILEENTTEPAFAVVLRPAIRKGGILNLNPGYVQGEGLTLRTILTYAFSTYATRLESSSDLLDTRYDFCVSIPKGGNDEPLLLREALQRAFNLKVHLDKREVDALVLTAPSPKMPELKSMGPTMFTFVLDLEWRLKRFVVDETGLRGYYKFERPQDGEDIPQFLIDHLGLQLSPAKRTVEILVVDSLELPEVGVTLPGR